MRRIRRKARRAKKKEPSVFGIAWYKREQWQRLLEISEDRDKLEESYDEWLVWVSRHLEQLRSRGLDPVRVVVDTEDLLAWCRSRNLPVDGDARARYTTEKLKETYETSIE